MALPIYFFTPVMTGDSIGDFVENYCAWDFGGRRATVIGPVLDGFEAEVKEHTFKCTLSSVAFFAFKILTLPTLIIPVAMLIAKRSFRQVKYYELPRSTDSKIKIEAWKSLSPESRLELLGKDQILNNLDVEEFFKRTPEERADFYALATNGYKVWNWLNSERTRIESFFALDHQKRATLRFDIVGFESHGLYGALEKGKFTLKELFEQLSDDQRYEMYRAYSKARDVSDVRAALDDLSLTLSEFFMLTEEQRNEICSGSGYRYIKDFLAWGPMTLAEFFNLPRTLRNELYNNYVPIQRFRERGIIFSLTNLIRLSPEQRAQIYSGSFSWDSAEDFQRAARTVPSLLN